MQAVNLPANLPLSNLVVVRVSLSPSDSMTSIMERDAAAVLADAHVFDGVLVETWELGSPVNLSHPPVPTATMTAAEFEAVAF